MDGAQEGAGATAPSAGAPTTHRSILVSLRLTRDRQRVGNPLVTRYGRRIPSTSAQHREAVWQKILAHYGKNALRLDLLDPREAGMQAWDTPVAIGR